MREEQHDCAGSESKGLDEGKVFDARYDPIGGECLDVSHVVLDTGRLLGLGVVNDEIRTLGQGAVGFGVVWHLLVRRDGFRIRAARQHGPAAVLYPGCQFRFAGTRR